MTKILLPKRPQRNKGRMLVVEKITVMGEK